MAMNDGYTVHLRKAALPDIRQLSELAMETYAAAFGQSMSPSDLAAHLAKNLQPVHFEHMLAESTILVAEIEGQMIGYVQFGQNPQPSPDEGRWELRRLYVRSEFQSQGIGTRLMAAALAFPGMREAKQISLDVWEYNQGAIRFYERFGFQVVGTQEFSVESGAETSLDLIMTLQRPD